MEIWARHIDPLGQPGPDYWYYFARRVAELADLPRDGDDEIVAVACAAAVVLGGVQIEAKSIR